MALSKLAAEILLSILEKLDPESLRRFSKTCRRYLGIVMGFKSLRYQLELGLSGMQDGPPSNFPISARLGQLLHHKKALPMLCWSHDDDLRLSMPAPIGVSGGYLYHIHFHLELYELPSARVGRAHSSQRRLRYTVPFSIQSVTIDAAQDLMVIGEMFQQNEPISMRLHFRQLSTNAKHSRSSVGHATFTLDWGDDPEHTVAVQHVEICGDIIGLSLCLDIGHERTNKFALVNWRTSQAIMWVSEVLSFQFLDETRVIVVVRPDDDDDDDESDDYPPQSDGITAHDVTAPVLAIHSISRLRDSEGAQIRVFHLPEAWSNAVSIQIETNSSPKSESHVMANTHFYPDPDRRIFVLTAICRKANVPIGRLPRTVLIMRDSLFKSTRPGIVDVSWNKWDRHCILRELTPAAHSLRVIGSRIFFSEYVSDGMRPSPGPRMPRSCVRLIDFNPHAVECIGTSARSAAPWSWIGRSGWRTITSIEPVPTLPHIRTKTVDSYEIARFFATEDNLILVLASPNAPEAIVKILTFNELPGSLLSP